MTKIEQRRKLIEAATPGPWSLDEYDNRKVTGSVYFLASMAGPAEHQPADAALIVAAVNDYAALLEIAEAAQSDAKHGSAPGPRLRAALAKFEEES